MYYVETNPTQANPPSDPMAFQIFNNTYANALINAQLSSKSRFEATTTTRNIGQKSSKASRSSQLLQHRLHILLQFRWIFPNRNCANAEIDASN